MRAALSDTVLSDTANTYTLCPAENPNRKTLTNEMEHQELVQDFINIFSERILEINGMDIHEFVADIFQEIEDEMEVPKTLFWCIHHIYTKIIVYTYTLEQDLLTIYLHYESENSVYLCCWDKTGIKLESRCATTRKKL